MANSGLDIYLIHYSGNFPKSKLDSLRDSLTCEKLKVNFQYVI
jgi:hypothetical protein